MPAQDEVIPLWRYLANQFNVAVFSVGVGKNDQKIDTLDVMIKDDDPVDPTTLPNTFAGHPVTYQKGRLPDPLKNVI